MNYAHYPYKDCIKCEGLGDCPLPDVALNGFGTPMYPKECPKNIEVKKVAMIFEDLIKENKEAFLKKVSEIAGFLGVLPNWLMFLMWFETGRTLDHRVRNSIGATGLIQFMPSTAIGLGTTTDLLRNMTNVEQLEYVKMHLAPFQGKYQDWLDLYCAIFWPAALGKPDSYKITQAVVAKANPLFDLNKDSVIEKAEIRTALLNQVPEKYKIYFT